MTSPYDPGYTIRALLLSIRGIGLVKLLSSSTSFENINPIKIGNEKKLYEFVNSI